jgi:GT2 family glycosyltransferase/glycosyltransferase involved in cell wall biosynthesis
MTSDLILGNKALKEKNYAQALKHYHAAIANQPELTRMIKANIQLVEKKLALNSGASAEAAGKQVSAETIDIVVPVYNALDDVKLCLQSLAKHTDGFKVRVLVVNDGSDEPTTQWLREFCASDSLFQLIEHPVNKGYTCAVNTGLRASKAQYVITQNSDTIVPAGWLQGMVRCMKSDPKIGVVGPLSNAATWQNVPTLRDETGGFAVNDLPAGHSVDSMAQLVASVSIRKYPYLPFINGFCFMIRRSVIDSIGYMDEDNFPIGYAEENDYCIRVIDAGYSLRVVDDVFVYHAKSKSFGHEKRIKLSKDGAINLRKKHTSHRISTLLAKIVAEKYLDELRRLINDHLKNRKNENVPAIIKSDNNLSDKIVKSKSKIKDKLIFGEKISEYAIRANRPISLPFFSVLIYAESIGQELRLTLESVVLALGNLNSTIAVICDWDDADKDDIDIVKGKGIVLFNQKVKKGFYLSVSEYISKSEIKNIIILRAGVVVTSAGIVSMVKNVVSDDLFDVASIFSNNTPHFKCDIRSGGNIHLTNILLKNLFGEGTSREVLIPGFECFMVTGKALKLVPFPRWTIQQDQSPQSLIRWFQALAIHNARLGLLLDAYAYVLTNKQISDEEIEKKLDLRYLEPVKNKLLIDIECAQKLNKHIERSNPVIQPGNTVCFILQSLKLGGGGLVIANLANHLILLGYDVRVYTKHLDQNYKIGFNLLFEARVFSDVRHVVEETPVNTSYIATLWTTARTVEDIVKYGRGAKGYYYIQDYEPYFYETTNSDIKQLEYRRGASDSYLAKLQWVYTSNWIRKQLDTNGHICVNDPIKINVGIDHSIFYPSKFIDMPNSGNPIIIGAMARPSTPRRGFNLLVDSLRIIKERHPTVQIILFGEKDYSEYKIPFEFLNKGILKPGEMSVQYKNFDIFLDTSDFQGFGLCALEAMSAGCACVITNCGGVLEYADHNFNSLITSHDESDIANNVELLVNNFDLRYRLGVAAIQTAKRFDIFNNARAWSDILKPNLKLSDKGDCGCAIVVPVFNNIHVVRRCIESVLLTLREKDLLVLVDDASDFHTQAELERYANDADNIHLIRNEDNLGFVGASNRGMDIAKVLGKDVILLNSDTIVPFKWIERLELAAYSQERPSVVSPLATDSSHLKIVLNSGDSFILADQWISSNISPDYPEIITPEGWCFYVPREIYNTIGFIDVAFGRGYCEESDLCMRAYVAGFNLRCCDNLLVYHQGKVSFGEERSSLYEKNRKLFDRRWSVIYERIYPPFIKRDPLALVRVGYRDSSIHSDIIGEKNFDSLTNILNDVNIHDSILEVGKRDYSKALRSSPTRSVAFLLPEFLPYGGVLSVVSLANELVLKGVDAKIVVLKSEGYNGDDLKSLTKPIFLENLHDLTNNFPDVDLLVSTGWVTVYYASLVLIRRSSMRIAYYVQDFEPDFPDVKSNSIFYAAAIKTYHLSLPSFCKSTWIRDKLIEAGCKGVQLVPPSLDVDVFYRRDQHKDIDVKRCDILAMYRPDTIQRDPETLLKVIDRIRKQRPGTRIWFFGENERSQALVAKGVIDQALGVVNNTMLPMLYSQAKVFLETSLFHGFGRTIAEAMSCETACVITNSGGPMDFASNNVNAIVCSPGDIDGLVIGTISLLDDDMKRRTISSSARLSLLGFSPKRSAFSISQFLNINLN